MYVLLLLVDFSNETDSLRQTKRLLQSTKPGRADHELLIIANQRIDRLIHIATTPQSNDTATDNNHVDDDELFALYDDYATEEPEEQEKARAGRKAFRDTIMDLYGSSHLGNDISSAHDNGNDSKATVDEDGQDLANITPRSVKMLSRIPDIHVSNVKIHPSPLSPPPQRVDESSSASFEESLQQSSTEKRSAESTPVQMTYIQPAVHKATLIRQDNDKEDDDDDIPLIPQQPQPAVSSRVDNNNNLRTSSQASSERQNQGQQHTVMQTMQSLRSALTASIDSFTDSTTHSLQSTYSAPRSSSSTAATDTVPNAYIEEGKPLQPSTNTLISDQQHQQSSSNIQSSDSIDRHQESMQQLMMNSSSDSIAPVSNFGGEQRDQQEKQSNGNQLQTLESPPESVSLFILE